MINVSTAFREQIKERTDFREWAKVEFADGTIAYFGQQIDMPTGVSAVSEFAASNNTITNAADSSSFPLGAAISRHIQMEIANPFDDNGVGLLDQYVWIGAIIQLRLYYDLYKYDTEGNLILNEDGTIATSKTYISMGYYTVTEPESYGTVVSVVAFDDMYKADKAVDVNVFNDYATSGVMKIPLISALSIICKKCGIGYSLIGSVGSSFPNSTQSFPISNISSNITYRQLIGYIAMLAGGNAVIDLSTNSLKIINYDLSYYDLFDEDELDGGTYDFDEAEEVDGGDYFTWDDDEITGGTYYPWTKETDGEQVLEDFFNLTLDTDDIIITGLEVDITETAEDGSTSETTQIYPEGASGYNLKIENPLIAGVESTFMPLLQSILVGGRFRKFEGDYISYPLAEFGDHVFVVDRLGKIYNSIVTDIDFAFYGSTTLKNSAESATRNSSSYSSATTQAVQATEKLVAKERTAREQAVEQLNELIDAASGLYSYEITESDGSTTVYLYDIKSDATSKPYIGSNIIIKINAGGIGFCVDGSGTNFEYGYDFTTNDAIVNILNANGINASWINTGAFIIKDSAGNIVFKADTNRPNDADGVQIANWFASSGYLSCRRADIGVGVGNNSTGNFLWVTQYESDDSSAVINRPFYVTHEGFLYAQNAEIEGKVTAGEGEIGGWSLTSNYLESLNAGEIRTYANTDRSGANARVSSGGFEFYSGTTKLMTMKRDSVQHINLSTGTSTSVDAVTMDLTNQGWLILRDASERGRIFFEGSTGDIEFDGNSFFLGDISITGDSYISATRVSLASGVPTLLGIDSNNKIVAYDYGVDGTIKLSQVSGSNYTTYELKFKNGILYDW